MAGKAYARQAKNWEVYAVDRPLKLQKKETPMFGFSNEDYMGVSLPTLTLWLLH